MEGEAFSWFPAQPVGTNFSGGRFRFQGNDWTEGVPMVYHMGMTKNPVIKRDPMTWRLRMAAAERGVWTGAELRRRLAERAGLRLSAASVSALMTSEPAMIRLSTLAALCIALECAPCDLLKWEE